jgi:hypothetical protein
MMYDVTFFSQLFSGFEFRPICPPAASQLKIPLTADVLTRTQPG